MDRLRLILVQGQSQIFKPPSVSLSLSFFLFQRSSVQDLELKLEYNVNNHVFISVYSPETKTESAMFLQPEPNWRRDGFNSCTLDL